ncbi:MAG: SAM-dependent chlorinase/fluorinase [Dehalococcoidia bacterium]
MRLPTIITLTTDFGPGEYAAAMKGVILGINPQALLVDISHQVEPQDILDGAFVLAATCPYFPPGTIHVAVVDPGVGTGRRPLVVQTPDALFVAPDNGLLSLALKGSEYQAYELTQPQYWREEVSATFHGRDIFAPAAAHLSLGVSPQDMGRPVADMVKLPLPPVEAVGGEVRGRVIHIDRFGNLITNIRQKDLPSGPIRIEISGRRIEGLSSHYQAGEELVALMGSSGYLEIAAPGASAARLLSARRGLPVTVASG